MKQIMRPVLAAVLVAGVLGFAGAALAQAPTKAKAKAAPAAAHVDKTKASEVLGFGLVSGYPQWGRDMIDPAAVGAAVTRALQGQKPKLGEDEFQSVAEAFRTQLQTRGEEQFQKMADANKKAGDAFLAKNKTQPGVKVTADGLQYQIVKEGKGPKPTAADTVQVNYTGTFINGQEFDSSARHGTEPAKLNLAQVVPGFKEALMLMPVGSNFRFAIPSDLAYGAEPRGQMPPNATLLFDITLIKIGAE